jgi:hypothetical protein
MNAKCPAPATVLALALGRFATTYWPWYLPLSTASSSAMMMRTGTVMVARLSEVKTTAMGASLLLVV